MCGRLGLSRRSPVSVPPLGPSSGAAACAPIIGSVPRALSALSALTRVPLEPLKRLATEGQEAVPEGLKLSIGFIKLCAHLGHFLISKF